MQTISNVKWSKFEYKVNVKYSIRIYIVGVFFIHPHNIVILNILFKSKEFNTRENEELGQDTLIYFIISWSCSSNCE